MRIGTRRARADLERDLRDEQARRQASEAVAAQLSAALHALPVGVVLRSPDGAIQRNKAAGLAGHANVLLDAAVGKLLAAAASDSPVEQRLDLFGPPARVLLLRGVRLADGASMVVVDDLSERARLDIVRTDFVANVSHELKTPVGAIAVLAEAVAGSDDLEVSRGLADKMVDEAHRAASTIDDLLELARIEMGTLTELESVHVSTVVAEAVARHRHSAEQRGISVTASCDGAGEIVADSRQLVSAVGNLVDNAIKYSPRDGQVSVQAGASDQWVRIDVIDRGIGIPAKDLDRVFERFYRVDRARSRSTGGTGLGLAIVRHVAANHGGDVRVISREGEGSTFTLRLPRAATAERGDPR